MNVSKFNRISRYVYLFSSVVVFVCANIVWHREHSTLNGYFVAAGCFMLSIGLLEAVIVHYRRKRLS
jgi:hypothetical protein